MASPYIELAKTAVDGIDVLKLRSKKTGILVYLAQVNGPSVDGFVCLGKESHLSSRHFFAISCHRRARSSSGVLLYVLLYVSCFF